jgi:hypothetical protein
VVLVVVVVGSTKGRETGGPGHVVAVEARSRGNRARVCVGGWVMR